MRTRSTTVSRQKDGGVTKENFSTWAKMLKAQDQAGREFSEKHKIGISEKETNKWHKKRGKIPWRKVDSARSSRRAVFPRPAPARAGRHLHMHSHF